MNVVYIGYFGVGLILVRENLISGVSDKISIMQLIYVKIAFFQCVQTWLYKLLPATVLHFMVIIFMARILQAIFHSFSILTSWFTLSFIC